MTTVNVTEIELNEFIGKEDKEQHCKATFPLVGAHGSKKLATVYFELEPGDHLGRHTDSAEELLVILDGQVEALVGTEKQKAGKGALVLIPEMVPHDLKNIGETTAKVLGVFGGANNIVATFDNEMLPTESNVVDTSLLFS
ncbi:MAG: cupin domain-containing protein [Allomuricauda sp.]|jgi:quercetin dioxygenase-like cupin family protein|uniref:cupin domain-containing protein n=1 Tax=Allomuricauda sp. CP2A TaxID=1848189 RepID=UPI0008305B4C|nr:cupin domain-containing protein [Muricauda sp. CP2A]